MIKQCLFFALLIPCYQETNFYVKLKDGTFLKASIETNEIELRTDKELVKIDIRNLQMLKYSKDSVNIKTTKDTVTGTLVTEVIKLRTIHGTLDIKTKDIGLISTTSNVLVDGAVGFWDFSGSEELKVNGGAFVKNDGVDAIKLDLSKGDFIEIPHNNKFSQGESVTVEMRVKLDEMKGTSYFRLFTKPGEDTGEDPNGGNYNILLWPASGHFSIGARNEKSDYVWLFTKVNIEEKKWHHLVFTWDVKNDDIRVSLDGKTAASFKTSGGNNSFKDTKLKTNKSPIYVCKQTYEQTNTIYFDYIRIIDKVLSESEIKELYENGFLATISKDSEFNTVVTTTNGERYVGKLIQDELPVETNSEDKKIDVKKISKISFCRFRKDDLKDLYNKAQELITQLGHDDAPKRESAQEELEKIGWLIRPVLEQNKDHKDMEIKTRIGNLLDSIKVPSNEVVIDTITLDDKILECWLKESIKLKTRFGDIEFKLGNLKTLVVTKAK